MSYNVDEFVNITPFDEVDNMLDRDVLSDHSEIGLEIDTDKFLLSWNISNPKYHPYFKYGETFKNTHLYVAEPYVDNKLVPQLEDKICKQLDVFIKNIDSGSFPVQVIIEGYDEFYKKLANRLISYPNVSFNFIRYEPTENNFTSNISGILVDTNIFDVLESDIESITYCATEDNDKVKTTLYPYVRLRNKYTNAICIVIAVHVNGCASQYPVSGLESLKTLIISLYTKYQNNIIAIGDYNTPPSYAAKVFDNTLFNISTSDYLTHCNPNSQASKYDIAITYPKSYFLNTMTADHVSDYSLALIDSIMYAVSDFVIDDENTNNEQ